MSKVGSLLRRGMLAPIKAVLPKNPWLRVVVYALPVVLLLALFGPALDVALKLERGRVSLRLLHGPHGFPALPWNFSPSPASYDLPTEYEGLWRPWVKLVCPCAVKLSPLPEQLEF